MIYLSVIIPAYNEEKRLPETLKKVKDFLAKQDYSYEVIIVNDGSKDETATVVSDWIQQKSEILNPKFETNSKSQIQNSKLNNFRLIDNEVNQGKGSVVKQGMLEAKGEWRLFMDADGSTDISEIQKLLKFTNQKKINTHGVIPGMPAGKAGLTRNPGLDSRFRGNDKGDYYEVIIGSRYLDKGSIKIKQPLSRRIVSRLGNIIVRVVLGIKSVDTQCGFKLLSGKASQDIFPKQTIDRWGFDVEILAIAIKLGYQIKEVHWYDAEGSLVKKTAVFKTLKEIWQVKRNLMRRKYN
jgi:dolichyl-phosphate beta-glucosyltransferase